MVSHCYLLTLAVCLFSISLTAKGVREVALGESEIGRINTTMRHSTLIQFSARPIAVIGDQDSFKVEYLGNTVSIKPLVPRSSTNLFVFASGEQFSFHVYAVEAREADDVVHVRRKVSLSKEGAALFIAESPFAPRYEWAKTSAEHRTAVENENRITVGPLRLTKSRKVVVATFVVELSEANGLSFSTVALHVMHAGHEIPIQSRFVRSQKRVGSRLQVQGDLAFAVTNSMHQDEPKLSVVVPGKRSILQVSIPLKKLL